MKFIWFIFLASFCMVSCSKDDNEIKTNPFSLEASYEVPVGDTLNIPIRNGSGELSFENLNESNIEVAYSRLKFVTQETKGYLSIIGKKRSEENNIIITDDKTKEECCSAIKVTSPYIALHFENSESLFKKWGMPTGDLSFILVANTQKDCYVLSYNNMNFQYSKIPVYFGSYCMSPDGELLSFNLKSKYGNFEKTFKILAIDCNIFSKLSLGEDIDKEPRGEYLCKVVDETPSQNEIINAIVNYKGFIIPNGILK